jgi:hypothetical protein
MNVDMQSNRQWDGASVDIMTPRPLERVPIIGIRRGERTLVEGRPQLGQVSGFLME